MKIVVTIAWALLVGTGITSPSSPALAGSGAGGANAESVSEQHTDAPSIDHAERRPNRLLQEKSPYLLQHAYNPVDWYPWGEEAFERAKREDKPIAQLEERVEP